MDTFELVINRTRLWASELQKGRLLYLPDEGDLVFLIEQIASTAEGSTRNDEMTVTGRSLEGIAMAERLVEPPAGESHDRVTVVAAETAMKHYVAANAADLADAARQVPGLVVAADAARGPDVTVAGRYQTVFDLVREIGLVAGLGWEITYDPAGDAFVFDVVEGADRQASVFFDFAFETLERWDELDSVLDAKTLALVAGQGEGVDRDIATRFSGSEPTGFDRREAFLDARDVELGATTILEQRGDAFLAATAAETRLEAGIHQYGAFRYRAHWDVGDVVLVRNAERGLSYAVRVVEVEKAFERSAAAPTITATLGAPFPTLRSQASTGGGSAATADGAVSTATGGGVPGRLGRALARARPARGLAAVRRLVPRAIGVPLAVRRHRHDLRRRGREPLQPPRLPRPGARRAQRRRPRLRHPRRDSRREDRDALGPQRHPARRPQRHPASGAREPRGHASLRRTRPWPTARTRARTSPRTRAPRSGRTRATATSCRS